MQPDTIIKTEIYPSGISNSMATELTTTEEIAAPPAQSMVSGFNIILGTFILITAVLILFLIAKINKDQN